LRAFARFTAVRQQLGEEFEGELDAAIARVRAQPLSFPIERGVARRCDLTRFPYSIIFIDLPAYIWVIAVAHHHRRPGYWLRRRRTA